LTAPGAKPLSVLGGVEGYPVAWRSITRPPLDLGKREWHTERATITLDIRLIKWHYRLMDQDNSYMSELFRIVNGALRLDIDKVRNYTSFLAEKLEKAGDLASAGRLRKMLEESDQQLRPAGSAFARALPVDEESRFPLIERVNLKTLAEPPVVLGLDQWDIINEFLSIAKSYAQVDVNCLTTSLSFLLYGPPGTGKSTARRAYLLVSGEYVEEHSCAF
jgi:hypothetical protein